MQEKRKLISIVIPVYNEEGNIEPLFNGIKSAISKLSDYYFEIIFVDDGSTDETMRRIENLPDDEQFTINYQHTRRNIGKTEALKRGFGVSKGETIITMDGDLQDDPKYIPDYINKLENENFDMVVGNRSNRYSKNALKWFSSHIANKITKILSGSSISDMNCGYKIITSECAKTMVLKSDYHRYLPLLAGIEGFLVGEIEITQNKRHSGDSKYGKTGLGRFMVSALDMISIYFIYKFRKEPFRIFGRIGFILILIGLIILGYLSILWFGGQYIRSRPMFFLGILLTIIGTNVLGMGLLGEIMVMSSAKKEKD